jgi:hypothetical protein
MEERSRSNEKWEQATAEMEMKRNRSPTCEDPWGLEELLISSCSDMGNEK